MSVPKDKTKRPSGGAATPLSDDRLDEILRAAAEAGGEGDDLGLIIDFMLDQRNLSDSIPKPE